MSKPTAKIPNGKKQKTVEAKLMINVLVGLGSSFISLKSLANTLRTTVISLLSELSVFPLRYIGCFIKLAGVSCHSSHPGDTEMSLNGHYRYHLFCTYVPNNVLMPELSTVL